MTYFYVVSAINAAGESANSNEASATPVDLPGCDVEIDFDAGSAAGWTNSGAATCSTGSFVVATPSEQINGGVTTQVGGDHTSGTGNAFFSATNTSAGANDVDGGVCIALLPVYPTLNAAWTNASVAIPAGSDAALRVQCSDGTASGDLVECGIDDVSICAP